MVVVHYSAWYFGLIGVCICGSKEAEGFLVLEVYIAQLSLSARRVCCLELWVFSGIPQCLCLIGTQSGPSSCQSRVMNDDRSTMSGLMVSGSCILFLPKKPAVRLCAGQPGLNIPSWLFSFINYSVNSTYPVGTDASPPFIFP
eukprot:EG_transcript_18674